MPTYAYKCTACGHASDEWLKMSEATAERVCPTCGKVEYRKQVSAPAFQLKGGGWYVTDFRDNKSKTAPSEAGKPTEGGGDNTVKPAETPAAVPAVDTAASPAAGTTTSE